MLVPQVLGSIRALFPDRRRTRQGAQLLWRDDGPGRIDRPVRRRRAGGVEPVRSRLAHCVPGQAADRHPGDARCLAAGAGDQRQPPPAARHRRRGVGVAGAGLPGAAAVRGPPAGLARLDALPCSPRCRCWPRLPVVRGAADRARRQPAARPRACSAIPSFRRGVLVGTLFFFTTSFYVLFAIYEQEGYGTDPLFTGLAILPYGDRPVRRPAGDRAAAGATAPLAADASAWRSR